MSRIKGLTVEFSADTSSFKRELKSFDKDLKSTERELRAVQQSLRLEFDADKLVKGQELAQEAIKGTEERANILRQRLEHMSEVGIDDKNIQEYRNLQIDLEHTENKAKRLGNQLEQLNNMKMEQLQKSIEGVGQKLTKAGQAMAPISAAAAGLVGGLTAMGMSAASSAGEMEDVAHKIDMTVEQYQRLSYAADQSGVSMQRLERSYVLFRGAVGKGLQGEMSKSTDALAKLGLTMRDMENMSPEQAYMETIKRLADLEDETTRVTLATEIFNERVAADIIPLLREGADGIQALSDEYDTLYGLTNEQTKALADFDDQMLKIRTAFGNLTKQLGHAFLPVLQSMANFMEEKVIPAFAKFVAWFDGMSDGSKKAIAAVLTVVAALAPLLLIGGKLTGTFANMLPVLAKLKGAMAAALGPVGIIVAVLGLMYAKNEEFRETVNDLIKTLMASLMPILQSLGKIFASLVKALMPLIDMLAAYLTPILQITTKIIGGIIERFSGLIEIIAKATVWVLNLYEKFYGFVFKVLEPLIEKLGKVWDWLAKILRLDNKSVDLDVDVNYQDPGFDPLGGKVNQGITDQDALIGMFGANMNALNSVNNYNDNSHKNITVNLTIENYAAELDYDDVFEQINLRLARNF